MKKLLILHAFDPFRPTGVTRLLQLLCKLLKKNKCEVVLALPALSTEFSAITEEWETFSAELGMVEIAWWDSSYFSIPHRERFIHNLEQLNDRFQFDHVFAVGVVETGFATAIACKIMEIPFSVFVTYRDALCYHSLQPQEIETAITHASRIVMTNPQVFYQLQAFHQLEDRGMLIDPRPDRKELKSEVSQLKSRTENQQCEPYLVTTGHLDQFIHLGDLIRRIQSAASLESLSAWRHIGSCCPATKSRIESMLATESSPEFVHEAEAISRAKYVELVSNAALHVIPLGETDTNSAAYESEVWGGKTDYPGSHCFPKLRQRKRTLRSGKREANLTSMEQLAKDLAS